VTDIVVEIHVPLEETPGLAPGSYRYPWIDDIEEFLAVQEDVDLFDDGEEVDDFYVFFLTDAAEDVLLAVASKVAMLPRVPVGAFAMVTNSDAREFGLGRRVELPSR
jgi:hypothetical protein